VVGVSFGKPDKANEWVESQGFQYEVWSDTDKVLAEAMGAGQGFAPKRVSGLIDSDGQLVVFYPEVSVGTHPSDVLDDARRMVKDWAKK
jgi:peroxiredoxin